MTDNPDRHWCPEHGWFSTDGEASTICPECGRAGEPPDEVPPHVAGGPEQ